MRDVRSIAALGAASSALIVSVVLVASAWADEVRLGTRARCMRYGGIPAGFRREPTAGMVRIEGGTLVAGSTQGYAEERPGAEVEVAPFWLDRTEVTNAQFSAFVEATGYVTEAERAGSAPVFHVPSEAELATRSHVWWQEIEGASFRHPEGPSSDLRGRAQQPVVQVSYRDALAYAGWLGRRLPTEREWEYAARAGLDEAQLHRAPRGPRGKPSANFWQGVFPTKNTREDGFALHAPVGCFEANSLGLHDMIGNVWEWTSTPYGLHTMSAPAPDVPTTRRVIKGGSFLCSPDFCARYRASARQAQEPDLPAMHLGFRTARDG